MLQDLAIKLLVVAMMIAVGLELPLAELRAGLRKRGFLAVGLALNLLVTPLVVSGLTGLLGLGAGASVGLLICAVAPGGPTGPLFTRIARADLGFATSLQVCLCFVALLTAPLSLELFADASQQAGSALVWPMMRTLALYQLLPLCAGMVVRARSEALAKRLSKPVGMLANLLLFAVIIGMLVTRGHILLEQPPSVHALTCALVLAPIAAAFAWPGLRPTNLAVGFVTTVRNLSVALLLSASFFADDPTVDAVILVWAFYMMLLPALIALVLGRRAQTGEPST
ncbi:transmembrane transport protein [Enhygromyxa salina]|uniref:Transmembrane transport protein n=1 Tax=Enhygromyxa salina TaxID=215803 RepID=A0A0C2A3U5_9BACT|nr:bile acid:sodium symporter [Enhygromyxa salina]KIG18058.1 transmembrane transport protein [Enhygromyxa salina]